MLVIILVEMLLTNPPSKQQALFKRKIGNREKISADAVTVVIYMHKTYKYAVIHVIGGILLLFSAKKR